MSKFMYSAYLYFAITAPKPLDPDSEITFAWKVKFTNWSKYTPKHLYSGTYAKMFCPNFNFTFDCQHPSFQSE